jgi:hypothetical protein
MEPLAVKSERSGADEKAGASPAKRRAMTTRREILEHLVYVWGIRRPAELRRKTREYLAYRSRRSNAALYPALGPTLRVERRDEVQ